MTGLAHAAKLVGLLQDPDILQASRSVLPWTAQQRLTKADRDAERVRSLAPCVCVCVGGGPLFYIINHGCFFFSLSLCPFDSEGTGGV